jgi:uncharacterized membrane protein
MLRILMMFLFCFLFCSFIIGASTVSAQEAVTPQTIVKDIEQSYIKGKVITIKQEGKKNVGTTNNIFQNVEIELLEGSEKGKRITLEHGGIFTIQESQKVKPGETLLLSRLHGPQSKITYKIVDRYRLPALVWIILSFFLLVIVVAGRKGVGAIGGLIISIAIITLFIVPRILAGNDPLFISIIGAIAIFLPSIYLAHGVSQRTTIAVSATFISLVLTGLLGVVFVSVAKLSGLGSEDAYTLQQGFGSLINFQGLLLGGIIIGALGVLDDVTTTQAATVFALAEANQKASVKELFFQGFTVGREHITSLVNTLVLAYAGASIGIFIFLVISTTKTGEPLWVILNSEIIVEEIIRALAGSIGLIFAVPITTLLAAFFVKYSIKIK